MFLCIFVLSLIWYNKGIKFNFNKYSPNVSQNGGAKDGLDMNVGPAWHKGYTGKGVVVSILDDGIQTNHPDLAQNYVKIHKILYIYYVFI